MDNFHIYTFSADEDGMLANSHYFDTPGGIYLFDVQLLTDYVETLIDQIKTDIPDRDIVSVFISHPHPDHYGGSSLLKRRAKPVFISTKATARSIAKRADNDLQELKSRYKRRLPHTFIVPEVVFSGTKTIEFKGLTLRLSDSGAGESPSNLICYVPEASALITGDLVYNRVHLKLDEASPDDWRRALRSVAGLKIKKVYPGHGPVVGPEVIPHLIRYLDHFQLAVDYFTRDKDKLYPEDLRSIVNAMCDKYPDYRLAENMESGIEPEFARRRRRKAA